MTKEHPPIDDKTHSRPNLPNWLFWDVRYEEMDWHECYRYFITRVIEKGAEEHWKELIRDYGEPLVRHVLQHEATHLLSYVIPKICSYFNLKPEELCLNRQPWRGPFWP